MSYKPKKSKYPTRWAIRLGCGCVEWKEESERAQGYYARNFQNWYELITELEDIFGVRFAKKVASVGICDEWRTNESKPIKK